MVRSRRFLGLVMALAFLVAQLGVVVSPAQARRVVATIPLGVSPSLLVVNPTTHRVYVSQYQPGAGNILTDVGQSITVIDGLGNAVVGTIPFGAPVAAAGVDPSSNRIYVIEAVSPTGAVGVLDGSSNGILTAIPFSHPADLVVNPQTHRVYVDVGDEDPNGELAVVDGTTDSVVSTTPSAGLLAINAQANQLYVYNGHVGVIGRQSLDGAGGASATTPGYVWALAVDPTLNRLYLGMRQATQVVVLDGTSLATLATISLRGLPVSLAANPSSHRVYVTGDDGTLSIIDATTNAVVDTRPIGKPVGLVAVDPTLNRVLVTNPGSNSITVIDDVAASIPHDARYFPQTAFRVDNDAVWDYFTHRGGVANFGYPVSRTFLFRGLLVQFFQRRIVELDENGHPRLLNLLDAGLLPYDSFNQAKVPSFDPSLVGTAPPATDAGAILAFVGAHAPDVFQGRPVNFSQTFTNTVTPAVAFGASGGDPNLLPGFNLEMWGIPTSSPQFDPNNHNFVYLRFQRGIMHYDATCNCTQGILLADYLKSILTGRNLPPDLNQEAQASPLYKQYDPSQPNWVHNPSVLPNTDLTNTFTQE